MINYLINHIITEICINNVEKHLYNNFLNHSDIIYKTVIEKFFSSTITYHDCKIIYRDDTIITISFQSGEINNKILKYTDHSTNYHDKFIFIP